MSKIQKKHIPNILLICRMAIALVIFILFILIVEGYDTQNVYVLWHASYFIWGVHSLFFIIGLLFVIACITDWLDGFLARKYKWVSDFGKLWDPIADKILINITLIGLMITGYIPWWIVVIMIIRDVIIDASRMYAASKGKVIAADIYGKLKTIFQMLGIIVILFFFNESTQSTSGATNYYWTVQNGLLFIATVLSVISGINYVIKIYKPAIKHAK